MSRQAIMKAIDVVEKFDMIGLASLYSRRSEALYQLNIALQETEEALQKAKLRGAIQGILLMLIIAALTFVIGIQLTKG